MLEIKLLKRKFLYDSKELPDPNPKLSKEEVLDLYSNSYPELTSAQIVGPKIENNCQVFEFKTVMGTKG
jgi:PRTRC genetic system protein C